MLPGRQEPEKVVKSASRKTSTALPRKRCSKAVCRRHGAPGARRTKYWDGSRSSSETGTLVLSCQVSSPRDTMDTFHGCCSSLRALGGWSADPFLSGPHDVTVRERLPWLLRAIICHPFLQAPRRHSRVPPLRVSLPDGALNIGVRAPRRARCRPRGCVPQSVARCRIITSCARPNLAVHFRGPCARSEPRRPLPLPRRRRRPRRLR
ncbi:hypothetical protein B0H15DRAFT_865292 [Mycena belliarum]|uniref:Uncharacterized protein n=1 Tax=Mycena belliarum TaxID=1033014 RepID=A0AAD6TVB9_9AGAR|nr:hypothetical protein B0H15DRAFT_865292 [Mycena belliae]